MSDPARPERATAPAPGTQTPLTAIDILAFVCELFAFATLAIWGFAASPF